MMEYLFKFYGVDWLAITCVFFAMSLLGNKNKFGFVCAIIGCILWIIYGAMVGSIAQIVANLILIVINMRSLIKWIRVPVKVSPNA
jgi:hypothetical protein